MLGTEPLLIGDFPTQPPYFVVDFPSHDKSGSIFLRPVRWMVLCVFSNWIARIPKATAFPRWVRWRFPNGSTPIAGWFFFQTSESYGICHGTGVSARLFTPLL